MVTTTVVQREPITVPVTSGCFRLTSCMHFRANYYVNCTRWTEVYCTWIQTAKFLFCCWRQGSFFYLVLEIKLSAESDTVTVTRDINCFPFVPSGSFRACIKSYLPPEEWRLFACWYCASVRSVNSKVQWDSKRRNKFVCKKKVLLVAVLMCTAQYM